MTVVIKRLVRLEPERFAELLAESEHAGLDFLRRLADEWTSGVNPFERAGEALFAATVDSTLVGVCGLNVDPYAATDRVGRLRHLYVLSRWRRLGIERLRFQRRADVAHCTHVMEMR